MSEEAEEKNAPLDDPSFLIDSVVKQEKRYARNRRLALIGLSVIFLGLCSFCVLSSAFASIRIAIVPSPITSVSETAISSLRIQYSYPDTLNVGTPATFSVSIFNSEIQINATEANQRLLNATPIPNGTPNVPLTKAFGPGYMAFAYAQLDVSPASKFDLPQLRQDSQSLEQKQPAFNWTIAPRETTQALITVRIIGQWKPMAAGNEVDIPLWEDSKSYDVSTFEPFIIQALTTLGGALFAILPVCGGIGLTIPWILDQIRKKRNQTRQSKQKRPQRRRKQGE